MRIESYLILLGMLLATAYAADQLQTNNEPATTAAAAESAATLTAIIRFRIDDQ